MKLFGWIERAIVTVFWTGFSPISPGTVASAVTCILLWFIPGAMQWPAALLIIPATFAGTLLSTRAIGVLAAPLDSKFKKLRRPDPSVGDPDPVTIDEFVGQWIALLTAPHTIIGFGLGFIFFRLFDIVKPFGIRKLQELPSGWGIMLDDVGAGFAGATCVYVLRMLVPSVMECPWPLV